MSAMIISWCPGQNDACDPCKPKPPTQGAPVTPNACGYYGGVVQKLLSSGVVLSTVYVGGGGDTAGDFVPGTGYGYDLIYVAVEYDIKWASSPDYQGVWIGNFVSAAYAMDAVEQTLAASCHQ